LNTILSEDYSSASGILLGHTTKDVEQKSNKFD